MAPSANQRPPISEACKIVLDSKPQYDHKRAEVRYSCLGCDFPDMKKICPEVKSREGIRLRAPYHGYKNTTIDGRPCLHWNQVIERPGIHGPELGDP